MKITPRDLFELSKSDAAKPPLIVDIRPSGQYQAAHIDSSVNIPFNQLDPLLINRLRGTDLQGALYLVCQGGVRSTEAQKRLSSAGISAVVNIEGGVHAWEKAGLPLTKGTSSSSIPIERQVFVVAGVLVLTGVLLSYLIHPWFVGLSGFVGAGLTFSGLTGNCYMAKLLQVMPWNRD